MLRISRRKIFTERYHNILEYITLLSHKNHHLSKSCKPEVVALYVDTVWPRF